MRTAHTSTCPSITAGSTATAAPPHAWSRRAPMSRPKHPRDRGSRKHRTMSAAVKYSSRGASIIGVRIRPLGMDDVSWKHDALVRAWGSTTVARKGELIDAAALPGYVAEVDGRRAGHVRPKG